MLTGSDTIEYNWTMSQKRIDVSAPGRLCLLGEHQDYFGLPVIAAAIDLRVNIQGTPWSHRSFHLDLPDIDDTEDLLLDEKLTYGRERDYLKSAVNILQREGTYFPSGWDCRIHGTIPINSGTSSSSALVVAWVKFLLEASGDKRAPIPEKIAELAYRAEVAEFKEPGGRMDHYTSALGGIVALDFKDPIQSQILPNPLGPFVLADSFIRKDTTGTLGHIKQGVWEGLKIAQAKLPGFTLYGALEELIQMIPKRNPEGNLRLLQGTFRTRDLTRRGRELFATEPFDHSAFGELLLNQQSVLREDLRVSLPKLDRMIETAMEAGALGAKINGSGEGGCIFAYAPASAEEVAEALRRLDTRADIVHIDSGVQSTDSE